MGVESYLLREDIVLHRADSFDDLEDLDMPDHAVGLVAETYNAVFCVEQSYDHEPTREEIARSYLSLDQRLTHALRQEGIDFSSVQLTPSNPEVDLPAYMHSKYSTEKKPFKALSLLWLWTLPGLQ